MNDLHLAPPHLDPETLKNRGSILNIVKSAHKWGGDGTVPDFDKIKRVLTTKHPEVIAKAFGGDPNRAAAWIKDQWYAIFRPGVQWRGKKDPTPGFSLPYQLVEASQIEDAELFLSDDSAETRSGSDLVWLPIAKTGRWAKSPLPGDKPLVLTRAFFDQVKQSFDQGAWEHVTVPLSHADRVDENTGFVRALDIRADPMRPGEWKLWGGIEFKLPEIKDKVLAGAIAGRSVGIATQGITRTLDGQHFPNVLKHVALTNQPWLSGLDDGEQLAASYDVVDESPDLAPLLGLADGFGSSTDNVGSAGAVKTVRMTPPGEMPADAHWRVAGKGQASCQGCTHFNGSDFCDLWNAATDASHTSDGFEATADTTTRETNASIEGGTIVARILGLASDSETEGTTADKADDVREAMALAKKKYPKGIPPAVRAAIFKDPDAWLKANGGDTDDTNMSRGGENMGEEVLELTREEFDAHVADQVALALARSEKEREEELDAMRRSNRELLVERKVASAQEAGHAPALIKVAEQVWLADTRETPILTLSREEGEVTISATQVVDDLLAAIPATALSAGDHAPAGLGLSRKPSEGSSATEAADAVWKRLKNEDDE